MTRRILVRATAVALGALVLATTVAAAGERWLHVRIVEHGGGGERVSVNLPLALVTRMLPAIETEQLSGGTLRLAHDELDGFDLPAFFRALREAEDGEFVRVDGPAERARVAKQGGFFLVDVEDEAERVRVRLPIAVVEALAASGSEQLDLVAALEALRRFDGQDLVTVEGGAETVRIWIDASENGER